jgi:hypothetical protein
VAVGQGGGQLGLDPAGVSIISMLLVPLLVAWGVGKLGWREVTVGTDGIVARAVGRPHFYAFTDIVDVVERRTSIELVMKNGRRELIWADPDDASLRTALVRRIEQARTAASSSPDARVELAAKGARAIAEWRDALVNQLRGAGGYRDAAITRDDALRVLDDPEARAEQRIAAALALVGSGDPDGASRVRVAAEASASPRLRVALERVADGDGDADAVDEALKSA